MTASDGKGERPVAGERPKISLCMIVRDNEPTIVPCLASIRPWVDEIIVVDTGSTDRTPQICEEFGAKVFHFPWIDDFSAARNESIRHATGEWVFWMDSDDTIDPECGRQLRELAMSSIAPSVLGFVMQVHCPGPDDELTVVDHVKLFRNRPEIRFEGRIHEQLIGSIRKLRGVIAWSDIFVRHSGSDTSEQGRQRKIERDFRILMKDLKERPDHPFVLFNLGMTHSDAGNHEEAAQWLRRCLSVSPWEQSHVRKAYALLVMCLTELGRLEEATNACAIGRKYYPQDAELLFRQGILANETGQFPEAVAAFRGAIEARESRHFSSLDPGIRGYKARNNMALAYAHQNLHDLAELQWRRILEERPLFYPAWRGLGDSLLAAGRHETLRQEIIQRDSDPKLRPTTLLLAAKLCKQAGELPEARAQLARAAADYPEDASCQEALAQALVSECDWECAETTLSRLTMLIPDDGAAWHNLGMVFYHLGKKDKALAALEQSLRVRPKAAQTQSMLQQVREMREVAAA